MKYINNIIACNDISLGTFLPEYLGKEMDSLGSAVLEEHIRICPYCYVVSSSQAKTKYKLRNPISRLVKDNDIEHKKDWLICFIGVLLAEATYRLSSSYQTRKTRAIYDERFANKYLRELSFDPGADFLRQIAIGWARGF